MFKKLKIKSINRLEPKKTFDIQIKDSHHYILENGVVSHNSQDLFPTAIMGGGEGVMYSASTVVFMSIAKLKTGDESTDSKAFVKDIGQSGIVVTAKSRKNRLAKPMQIKFEIDFDEGTNPYKGLEAFCTEENYEKVGIAKGKADKDGNFQPGGVKYYIRHLGKTLYEKEIFTNEVFTEEVLDQLEPIIEEYFSYASYEEQKKAYSKMEREIQEQIEKQEEGEVELVKEEKKTTTKSTTKSKTTKKK